MQPRFMVAILVKPERLVRRPRYVGFFGYFTPNIILAEPQQITILIGHFARDADLVAVEVVGLLAVFAVFVDVVLIGETTYVPHVPYVKNEGFVRATTYFTS